MKIYFVSDYHYGHTNIAGPRISKWKKGFRNFNSVHEMNKAIIESTNDTIKEKDLLIYQGDWSFGPESNITELRNSLVVKNIIMIWGNHDETVRKYYKHLFTECHELLHRKLEGINFVMCHYPIARWNRRHHGSIHTYGHEHHNYDNGDGSIDVGWCKWRRPLELSEVISLVKPVKEGRHD